MRFITVVALGVSIALTVVLRYCEGGLRVVVPDDDEDFRPISLYRDYSVIRRHAARTDDVVEDYGFLRYGRTED